MLIPRSPRGVRIPITAPTISPPPADPPPVGPAATVHRAEKPAPAAAAATTPARYPSQVFFGLRRGARRRRPPARPNARARVSCPGFLRARAGRRARAADGPPDEVGGRIAEPHGRESRQEPP